jgi:SAM-dependent methyltransferase
MFPGFPLSLISTLRCPREGGSIRPGEGYEPGADARFMMSGTLVCGCGARYPVEGGIVKLLDHAALDAESAHEQQLRDGNGEGPSSPDAPIWWNDVDNLLEIIPTRAAVAPRPDQTVLELGCGDGRYSIWLAGACRTLLAVDFSIGWLRKLRHRLGAASNVGLVLADVCGLEMAPGYFDTVFSTLVSNLPTRERREALYDLARHAGKPDGTFVFSVHHYGPKQRLRGEEKSGRYSEGGIYRYEHTLAECNSELAPFFASVRTRPIQVYLPLWKRLGLPLLPASRVAEKIPLLRMLGSLLLCVAQQPRSSLMAGDDRPGPRVRDRATRAYD